jgi:hypothetical protein
MVMTVGGGDSVNYGKSFILSLPLLPPPAAAEVPSLFINFPDGKISATNTTVHGEITSPTQHPTNTTSSVEKTMNTATTAGGASAHTPPPDSLQNPFHTPIKLNGVGGANTTVDRVITSPAMHATKTIRGVKTTMDTATNADGTTANPLPPDFVTP